MEDLNTFPELHCYFNYFYFNLKGPVFCNNFVIIKVKGTNFAPVFFQSIRNRENAQFVPLIRSVDPYKRYSYKYLLMSIYNTYFKNLGHENKT